MKDMKCHFFVSIKSVELLTLQLVYNSIIIYFNNLIHFYLRLLIAINRRDGPAVAKQTVKLAEEFLLSSDGVVVGLDLSGNPTVSF